MQVAIAALHIGRRRRVILVDTEHGDILERYLSLTIVAGKHLVKRCRGGTGRQAKPEEPPRILFFVILDCFDNDVGQFTATLGRV